MKTALENEAALAHAEIDPVTDARVRRPRGELSGRECAMKRCYTLRLTVLSTLILAPLAIARAGTIHGRVMNATTGKAAAGIELVLIQPQGGMQEVAHSKSGTQGEFTFNHPGLGVQPMLVRATYHGINFNHALPPRTSAARVDIYEASRDPKTINVPSHGVIVRPNGANLFVGEEYQIENKSRPPLVYIRSEGSFDFALPEGGKLQQVVATGPAGMPAVQVPIDKKNNRYSVAFAFQPGGNSVRYSYELPYVGNTATLKIPMIYPGGRLLVVAPPGVQISGDGLAPAGQEGNLSVYLYSHEDVPAGTLVAVSVSGTEPMPRRNAGAEQGQQGRDTPQGGEVARVRIPQGPGRLDVMKWPFVVGFVCVFALIAFLLARKPVVVVASPTPVQNDFSHVSQPEKSKPAASISPSAPPAPKSGTASLAQLDAGVGTNLDSLKERLFRLDLRHQAGTISDEEYARERARAEGGLRDLVRG